MAERTVPRIEDSLVARIRIGQWEVDSGIAS